MGREAEGAQGQGGKGGRDYQQKLQESRAHEKQDEARRKLQELKMASEERWEALKKGVEGAWRELRTSIDSSKGE